MRNEEYILPASPRRFTRAEYHQLIEFGLFARERLELVHGILLQMSPIGIAHRRVVSRLNKLLLPRLLGRAEVFIQQPYAAADDSEPEPDLAVVAPGEYASGHPSRAFLLIEVADTSLEYDRATKAPLYAASFVDEYWIVNLAERVVEVYREPANGKYGKLAYHRAGDVLSPAPFPDVAVSVAELIP